MLDNILLIIYCLLKNFFLLYMYLICNIGVIIVTSIWRKNMYEYFSVHVVSTVNVNHLTN